MRTVVRELQYAVRRLLGSPGFTIAAVLTLAIAIGATASVFSVVDGVLLKAFPYRDPDRVLTIWESNVGMNVPRAGVSAADYLDLRAQDSAFTALAAASERQFTVTGQHEPERVTGFAVTPNYFPVLGITPVLGRPLSPDSGGPAEVLIGYGFWQRRFGGSRSVIGQTLTVDDHSYTIVGVTPAGLPGPNDLWVRLSFTAADQINRGDKDYVVAGRLKPGVTAGGALRELETIARRLGETYPQTNKGWSVRTVPLLTIWVGEVKPALIMLLSAAGCVLLIGAANLANLFLVRCLAREREMAVRTALGATRGRLVGELLVEAATLGLAAGTLGVGVAVVGVRGLRALAPPWLPRLSDIGVDGRVVAFCALVSIATVLLFGVAPAWRASRGGPADVLKQGGRGTGSAQHHRLQDGLVVVQVAVALVLLTGAGLLVESFDHFQRMDPGFRPEGVLTATITLPAERYPTPERQSAFAASVVEQLAAQPGVQAASVSSSIPAGGDNTILGFAIVGDPVFDQGNFPVAYIVAASPDYFRTMGITLQRGRGVLPTDDGRAVKVAVVDELLVERLFGGRDPIGRRVAFIGSPDTMEVVGVVASVKQGGLTGEDRPEIYLPFAQSPSNFADVAVRTSTSAEAQTGEIKRVIAGLDGTVPLSDVKTESARIRESVGTTRFSSFLASLFAVVALVLGMVGIYSVLAYIVSQRRREIAVRIALGASRANVMSDVLQRALALTGLGIGLGSGTAWLLTRALEGLFLGVSPHDPAIFVGAAAAFALVALAAASVPAFRTTRINPVVALTSI
jgi:putative ABC transport system permease protein